MIAARRDVAAALGFDAQRFDGFHLYDADFSLRASVAGYAVSVVADITIYHRSTGDFDANWHRYHQIFLAAHAGRLDRVAPQPRRVARIPFSDIAAAAKEIDEQRIAELTPRLREPGARQP
jgi:GT2 family glycosyltransferase